MTPKTEKSQRLVVVHGGARDSYQVALGLHRAGMLEALVTDVFVSDKTAASWWFRLLPAALRNALRPRMAPLPARCVRLCPVSGLLATVLERSRRVPFSVRRWTRRFADRRLGEVAGRLAARSGAGLLSYSYTGTAAFQAYGSPALLFQVHPHPLTMQRLLTTERTNHPECAASLDQEWELALPADDLRTLVAESHAARAYLVASSFTRQSLTEHGVSPELISVVPYGIDLERFHPAPEKRGRTNTLQLLFVGRINQRKGILYLIRALEMLRGVHVHLTVCGRVVDDLALFNTVRDQVTIRPSVSPDELIDAYQSADLFVFPSIAEGFAQVLLESLACGLPVLSTTHTAAPDLIDDGVQGWIVEPGNVQQLVDRITWAAQHRTALAAMSLAARERAEQFTWLRFQQNVAHFAEQHVRETRGAETSNPVNPETASQRP